MLGFEAAPQRHDRQRAHFSGQAHRSDGVFDRISVEFETSIFEEAGQPRPMVERVADVLANIELLELIDSCFSNHGFKAETTGRECSLGAADRIFGDNPRTAASMA